MTDLFGSVFCLFTITGARVEIKSVNVTQRNWFLAATKTEENRKDCSERMKTAAEII